MDCNIKGVNFKCNIEIPIEEATTYVDMYLKDHPKMTNMDATIDGDDIEVEITEDEPMKFERIRRITGYLVGTLDRFNDAKRSEESQRVKHSV